MTKPSVLLLGAGVRGQRLLEGWSRTAVIDPARSAVVDPHPSDLVLLAASALGVEVNPVEDEGYDAVVLALPRFGVPDVLPALGWPGIERALFLSLVPEVTLAQLRALLAGNAPGALVLRALAAPNGAVLCRGEGEGLARPLLSPLGDIEAVDREQDLSLTPL